MKIIIEYEVVSSFTIEIEREELPANHQDLLDSVTRDELAEAPMQVNDLEWGHLKEAWRSSTPENTWVYNENHQNLY